MREHAPKTIERILTLRQFPGFEDSDLAELATVAENVSERTFPAGATIAMPMNRVPAIQLVVDGRLEAPESGHQWGPRRLFGALEAIADRQIAERVVAVEPTRTLQLATTAFAEILEDNYGVLSTTRRLLARRMLELDSSLAAKCRGPIATVAGPLGMVERLVILRSAMRFSSGGIQALSTLAQATEELELAPGSMLFRRGDEVQGPLVLLDGTVRIRQTNGRDVVLSSAALAGLETLAEVPHLTDAETITRVRALRVPTSALFDVMEDHTDFAIDLLRRLAGDLVDLARLPPEVN